jgi:hypothetical protein
MLLGFIASSLRRADTRVCPAGAKTFSVYCALEKATYELAAAVGQDGRTAGQARRLLLVVAGGESPHTAPVWEHVTQDRGAAITDRIDEPQTRRRFRRRSRLEKESV